MKIKYSVFVSDVRGKLNGSVASKNRYGAYLRNKVTPVNPQTTSQTAVRALLTSLSQAWRSLTDDQRLAWNAAVASFAKTNIFGDIVNPTGINLFIKLNSNLSNVGLPTINVPPVPEGMIDMGVPAMVFELSSPQFSATFADATIPAGYKMIAEATAPFSPGKSFVKNKYRVLISPATVTGNVLDMYTDYVAKFGVPAVGQKVGFRYKLVNSTTGQSGQYIAVSTIVAAS